MSSTGPFNQPTSTGDLFAYMYVDVYDWLYFEPFVIPTCLNDDVFLDDPDEGFKSKRISLIKLFSKLQVLLQLFDLFSG